MGIHFFGPTFAFGLESIESALALVGVGLGDHSRNLCPVLALLPEILQQPVLLLGPELLVLLLGPEFGLEQAVEGTPFGGRALKHIRDLSVFAEGLN